jgi:membrane-associated phospholipid phosphatase
MLAAPAHARQEPSGHGAVVDAALASHGIELRHLRSDVIVAWNGMAHDLAFAEDQFLTFKGQRALAMMHLAMHDALNAIVPVYETYAFTGRVRLAHPIAAAAQAAHDVLLSQYPGHQAALADQLTRWVAHVPGGVLRDRGILLGQATAAAVVARRNGDGWNFQGTYEFGEGPGRYQTTPPWNGFVAWPGFRFAKPFVLEYPHQFRPSPPPPLRTKAYARALGEVQKYGAADSMHRTSDQTAYAVWWMEFAEGSVNRLARQLASDRQMPLWRAARMFAHIGVALYDTYVATWDAKYEYAHWRPYTAVRAADTDGNPNTVPDADWESLRPAPPFPEYSSAHAAACAASFGVLADAFGRNLTFTMETTTAPPGMPTRTFESFSAAAAECADSRVRLGFHFRYATDAGLALGQRIARYTSSHALPVRPR